MEVNWTDALSWRTGRQLLDRPADATAVTVVERLCGVQSQVRSSAELAVAARTRTAVVGGVARGVRDTSLLRTWAMRGTLHTLTVADAPAFLSLLASARTWEKGTWQRTFLDVDRMQRLSEAVVDALAAGPLDRDQLVARVEERLGDPAVSAQLTSGWGTVLKPLAWQGLLCNGVGDDSRVTFASPAQVVPHWPGLPAPDAAARHAVPRFLAGHGPSSPDRFNQWLARGALRTAQVRAWFADLGDELAQVRVEGEPLWVLAADVDSLHAARADAQVRLLPGFDQYVLGAGTDDPQVVPAAHRKDVSRPSGWIAPVVLLGGRVVGTWTDDDHGVAVDLFPGGPDVPRAALDAEVERLRPALAGCRQAARGNR